MSICFFDFAQNLIFLSLQYLAFLQDIFDHCVICTQLQTLTI